MTDMDHELRQHFRKESDQLLFSEMEMSEKVKQSIRRQIAGEQEGRRFLLPRKWIMAAGTLAAAIAIVTGIQLLQQPGESTPSNEGSIGSELSQLITTQLDSVEEATSVFGAELLVPGSAPEGFTLSGIVAAGMAGEPVRDAVFTYVSGDKALTFAASRMEAAFPKELFAPTKVNGVAGFVFEQSEFTELFWTVGDIHYSVSGPISADDAMKMAESAQP